MKKILLIAASAAVFAAPHAHAILGVGDVVSDPIVEQATVQKNIFDQMKYAWEQTKWAEQLSHLSNTLTTVRQQLETANQVKQAIGDPAAAVSLIDNGLFSGYLQSSGIADTLSDLAGIAQQSAQLSGTIQELFQPINLTAWKNLGTSFNGVSSFGIPATLSSNTGRWKTPIPGFRNYCSKPRASGSSSRARLPSSTPS